MSNHSLTQNQAVFGVRFPFNTTFKVTELAGLVVTSFPIDLWEIYGRVWTHISNLNAWNLNLKILNIRWKMVVYGVDY